MLRIVLMVLIAGLLDGCAAVSPAAPISVAPSLVLGPVPALTSASGAKVALLTPPEAAPRSGEWTVTWFMGDQPHTEQVDLAFEPDGSVVVAQGDERHATPAAWTDGRVTFEGLIHREVNQNNAFSRERFELRAVSAVEMQGTRFIRVNFRWVACEARATFSALPRKGDAIDRGV